MQRFLVFFLSAALAACSGASLGSLGIPPGDDGGPQPTGDDGSAADVSVGDGPGSPLPDGALPQPDGATGCPYADSADHDGDHYAFTDGDCDDCDPTINPGAYDFAGNGVDEDCSGVPDDEPTLCDSMIVGLDDPSPMSAAKAIGLCRFSTLNAIGKQRTWGVVDAHYVLPDGTPPPSGNFDLGHGLLPKLGANLPKEGARLLALSSGTARNPTDPGYMDVSGFDKMYTNGTPAGFPTSLSPCPGVVLGAGHDGAALSLTIRVPTNVASLAFDTNFFAYDMPTYVCTAFNDPFVAILAPTVSPVAGGDLLFDAAKVPMTVDNAFLQECTPQTAGGINFTCPLGVAGLLGTGFSHDTGTMPADHGATGWLTTTAPVARGTTVMLLFAIWDSSDGVLDSTALIDNLTWSAQTAPVQTRR